MNLPSISLALSTPALALPALILVLGLVLLAGRIARWCGLPNRNAKSRSGIARLRIVETLRLDPKRQLLLLACDGREALVLAGGAQDVLVGWLPVTDQRP